jgi:hypothetical protein
LYEFGFSSVDHVQGIIDRGIEDALRRAKDADEAGRAETLRNKCAEVKQKEKGISQLPRHVLVKAAAKLEEHYNLPAETVEPSTLGLKIATSGGMSNIERYRQVVEGEFDAFWEKSVAMTQETSCKDAPAPEKKETEPETRIISVTLDRILRSEFPEEDKMRIRRLLTDKQERLSSHMDEIQATLMKAHLEVRDRVL